ncbi:MAG: glycosyltransferase [Lachnospiraceae bacterium]|nr:glycosyltransferase [Lachnospiraceae bacterium]
MGLVTVVVPVYNVAPFLERCIRSVLEQTCASFELILVDDGSTDGSGEICDRAAEKDRRIIVVHQENKGISEARNAGIDRALGESITFIDGDDFVNRRYLERLLEAKEKTASQISICAHKTFKKDSFSEEPPNPSVPQILDTEGLLDAALVGVPFFVSACMKLYDRHLFKGLRYPEGELYEDLGIFYKLFSGIQKGCFIDEALYYYRMRPGSILHSGFDRRKLSYLRFAEEGLAFIRKRHPACVPAAESKLLAASIDTLLMIGSPEDEELRFIQSRCHENIVRYRGSWKNDRRLRKLYRIVMFLSYLNLDAAFAGRYAL